MIRNYLTVALRSLFKHKTFTLINLLGLSVGLACSIFIFLWIYDELQFNRFHAHSEQIFRIMQNRQNEDGSIHTWGNTPYVLKEHLSDYPAIQKSVQLTDEEKLSVSAQDKTFKELSIFASTGFFNFFDFPLIQGDPETVLKEPFSVVLSRSAGRRLFEDEDALGKTIYLNAGEAIPFTVTGIFEDAPHHSTLQFDMVLPIEVVLPFWGDNTNWYNSYLTTYVMLDDGAEKANVEKQITSLEKEKGGLEHELFLHSLPDTYLYTRFKNGQAVGGRIDNIRLFAIVAILILLMPVSILSTLLQHVPPREHEKWVFVK